jgi:hypothetical protein
MIVNNEVVLSDIYLEGTALRDRKKKRRRAVRPPLSFAV